MRPRGTCLLGIVPIGLFDGELSGTIGKLGFASALRFASHGNFSLAFPQEQALYYIWSTTDERLLGTGEEWADTSCVQRTVSISRQTSEKNALHHRGEPRVVVGHLELLRMWP